jgi:hypothetical protein
MVLIVSNACITNFSNYVRQTTKIPPILISARTKRKGMGVVFYIDALHQLLFWLKIYTKGIITP